MINKPVRPRSSATGDAYQIVNHYEAEAGIAVADRFASALESGYRRLEATPAIGSPRAGERYNRPGLRTWPVKGFPYLICYFDTPDHIDVWRILHAARDLGALLDDRTGESG